MGRVKGLGPQAGRKPAVVCWPMTQHEALAILRAHAADIKARGVTALYLYGSVARDEATERSDVDLFADVDYDRFGFVSFMDLRDALAGWLDRKVDFTTRNGLHRDLRERIGKSAIKVFDDASVHQVAAE
jgi:uncharacterized protein